MKGVHLHQIDDERILVEMKGSVAEVVSVFDRLISSGATLYHPETIEDRFTERMLDYPDDELVVVDLEERRGQVETYRDWYGANKAWGTIQMVYITKTVEDAVLVKMSM